MAVKSVVRDGTEETCSKLTMGLCACMCLCFRPHQKNLSLSHCSILLHSPLSKVSSSCTFTTAQRSWKVGTKEKYVFRVESINIIVLALTTCGRQAVNQGTWQWKSLEVNHQCLSGYCWENELHGDVHIVALYGRCMENYLFALLSLLF